ncbi:MAG: DUF1501 domain-containing protein [Methylococcaceae bacterium]|nr:DUF1501 domain-containing protein [Methylococcaceae bacterium]
MNRRNFLKNSLYVSASTAMVAGLGVAPLRAIAASVQANITKKTLINVMLEGGPDLRYLFVPAPGSAYAKKFWQKRASLYRYNATMSTKYKSYLDVWTDLYLPTTFQGQTFGIHKNAAWLKQQFDLGNVAIVANVLGSSNRRHDHSQMIVNSGDLNAAQFDVRRDGWGGRLNFEIGASNVVSVSKGVSVFCHGVDPLNRNGNVIHARNTRNFALSLGNNTNPRSVPSVMGRVLKGYYAEKAKEIPLNSPYRRFIQHEQTLRTFGDALKNHLNTVSPTQPVSLSALYEAGNLGLLNNRNFGLQCANVYDSFLAADLFKMQVISMEYGGWDTHNQQKIRFENNLADVFGANGGLAALNNELGFVPGAIANTVYNFSGDFGRQLSVNGAFGTDHGRGSYQILVGNAVNGGIYGEMFPQSEISIINGTNRFDLQGADIEGRTSLFNILSKVSDWVQPGSSAAVFPDTVAGNLMVESGVDLTTLI